MATESLESHMKASLDPVVSQWGPRTSSTFSLLLPLAYSVPEDGTKGQNLTLRDVHAEGGAGRESMAWLSSKLAAFSQIDHQN